MNHTSRMTALLGELRRERNGAVADAMRLVGAPYGLNYGVSLPTLRRLARAEKPDYAFAKFLSLQDVRELRLAAYHIADPAGLTPGEFPFWASGIVNHELAEEAAFALLPRIGDFSALFRTWTAAGMPWPLQYAALMAASRVVPPDSGWVDSAVEAVRRAAAAAETVPPDVAASEGGLVSAAPVFAVVAGTGPAASAFPESGFSASATPSAACSVCTPAAALLVAQGAVALLAAVGSRNGESRQAVLRKAGSLGRLRAEDYVHEELAWWLEVQ